MPHQMIANTAAVATGHPLGAAAGLEVFKDGGNAIDAAVAAMIALCVVIPGSVGLGGYGGSAVIHVARRRNTVAIDFDSRAPLAFREGLVTADRGSNYYGAHSVTVPAVIAGLEYVLREFGTKSWADVSQPAIRLAAEGFEFDTEHERHLNRCAPHFDRQSLASLFPGDLPRLGYHWKQPALARFMRQLANDGPLSFYEGEIPKRLCAFLHERGGILTKDDFQSYEPQFVEPLYSNCRGHDFFTPPPPSGGLTSLSIIQTVEQLVGIHGLESLSAEYFHVLAEAMKLCWQERHEFLGDPEVVSVPIERLLSEQSAQLRSKQILAGGIRNGSPTADQSPHTGNVIAADADGNLISITATQGWMYGSHLVVGEMGLVLNHGMSRFDYSPDHPNAPAPGKRMQHNMSPMIALRDNQPTFAYGLPGGPKIVSVTAQLALNTIVFGMTPADSITAPRIHTDGNEPLKVSQHMPADVIADLETRGHFIRRENDMGGPVNVLAIDPQTQKIDIASGEATGAIAGL
jgi:gamma-glutamyltranspeptidase / glutathione hydrolase